MRLRVQTFANNEVRISRQSDLPNPPLRSDTAKEKRVTKYATASQQVMYLDRALSRLLSESPEPVLTYANDGIQLACVGEDKILNGRFEVVNSLPKTYKSLVSLPDGRFVVQSDSVDNLVSRRARALDIISKSQERPKKHSTYGEQQKPKVFSKLARHRLLEAGAVIDKLGLGGSASLLTLTLPGGTPEAKDALARWSGWIVNRQTQVLRDNKRFKGCYWFFVWEWQKRGALHQHWCLAADDYATASAAAEKMKDAWFKCLREISLKEGIDMFLREGGKKSWAHEPDKWVWNEQKVEKAVGAYFSKYASKEVAFSEEQKRNTRRKVYFPSRWFGSSANIKKACKAYRLDFSLHFIHPIEAEVLRHQLIAELYKFGVTSSYEYQFEAKSEKYQTVFCDGTTEIYYISPAKFSGVIDSFRRQFQRNSSGVFETASIQWSLHLARQMKDNVILPSLPFDPRYGYHVLYR